MCLFTAPTTEAINDVQRRFRAGSGKGPLISDSREHLFFLFTGLMTEIGDFIW